MEKYDRTEDCGPDLESRIRWLDVCKGICTLCVVLSHSYPPKLYERFYQPFFLRMFFFVSGYMFSTKNSFKEFIMNKGRRLLVPFLLLGLSRVLVYYAAEGGSLVERLKGFVLQIRGRYDEMWFVACFFTGSLLFYFVVLLCHRQKRYSEESLMLIVSFALTVFCFVNAFIWRIKFLWQFESACMMEKYMAFGYWYKRHEAGNSRGSGKAAIFLFMLYVFGISLSMNIDEQALVFSILSLLLSFIATLPIVYASKRICHSGFGHALAFLGRNTLFYYACAGIVRVLFYACCGYLGIENEYVLPIFCVLLSSVLMAFPAWFVRRYLPWAIGEKYGG